jgi:hypothetical protein
VPALAANPNAKVSKAATLQKGAEYCRWLKEDRAKMQDEEKLLKAEIEALNLAIRWVEQDVKVSGLLPCSS